MYVFVCIVWTIFLYETCIFSLKDDDYGDIHVAITRESNVNKKMKQKNGHGIRTRMTGTNRFDVKNTVGRGISRIFL